MSGSLFLSLLENIGPLIHRWGAAEVDSKVCFGFETLSAVASVIP